MAISDQNGWDDAYKVLTPKYGTIKRFLTRTSFEKVGFLDNVEKDELIIEIGCGDGNVMLFLQEQGYTNLSGFDINVYPPIDTSLDIVQGDMLNFPYPPSSADVLVSFNVMHHCQNHDQYRTFLDQCKIALRDDGQIFLIEPQYNIIRKLMMIVLYTPIIGNIGPFGALKKVIEEEKDELALFYRTDLSDLLEKNGFRVRYEMNHLKSVIIHAYVA